MGVWKSLRLILLVTTCGGVLWGLGKSILAPNPKQLADSTIVFPPTVPLLGWQPLGSQASINPSGRIYRYSQNNLNLDLEVYYVTDANANAEYFRRYSPKPLSASAPTPIVRENNQIGFYSLSVDQQQAYLRACINPQGQSTITYEQFMHNRNTDDLQFSRILPWLLGRVTFRDHRCLWTHLSMPIEGASTEFAYQTLETVWGPWYEWWQTRFPQP